MEWDGDGFSAWNGLGLSTRVAANASVILNLCAPANTETSSTVNFVERGYHQKMAPVN
jgi:hypothetical protein